MTTAYPLAWPAGWPRTAPGQRQSGAYRTGLPAALTNLRKEIELLAGKEAAAKLVLSSNATMLHVDQNEPGVVAYFTFQDLRVAIPCDRWSKIEHNIQAIALTIAAMRAMERHGAKHMIRAMFTGFTALPAPGARSWREVLDLPASTTLAEAEARYRELAVKAHPDGGGSHDAMTALNAAIVEARNALG